MITDLKATIFTALWLRRAPWCFTRATFYYYYPTLPEYPKSDFFRTNSTRIYSVSKVNRWNTKQI